MDSPRRLSAAERSTSGIIIAIRCDAFFLTNVPLWVQYWRGPEVLFLDTRIRRQRGSFRSRFDCRKRLDLLSMLHKFLGDLIGWSRGIEHPSQARGGAVFVLFSLFVFWRDSKLAREDHDDGFTAHYG